MAKYVCTVCGYVYEGDWEEVIFIISLRWKKN